MTMEVLDVRLADVGKQYGRSIVLENVRLQVTRGEFVIILGKSGSGKSTLLNLVGGLDEPTHGSVQVLGHDLESLDETERARLRASKLGFVFQFFNLIPTLTAAENVELPLALNGVARRAARRRAAAVLDELELAGCGQRFPDELSGGEQQRVAIARAIVHEPGLVLADEPTGNLDQETGSHVLDLLDDICRRRGTTLLMATHSNEALSRADRVLKIGERTIGEAVV